MFLKILGMYLALTLLIVFVAGIIDQNFDRAANVVLLWIGAYYLTNELFGKGRDQR